MTGGAGDGPDFEALFRAAPIGFVVTAPDGRIIDVNDAFAAWSGLDRDRLLGTPFLRLLAVGDRILFSTHTAPSLDLAGRVADVAVTLLGRDRARLPALLSASRIGTSTVGRSTQLAGGSMDAASTLYLLAERRERSFEEAQLISAVHRAEHADSRRKEAQEGLAHLENHDPMTGLLNRQGLLAALVDHLSGARHSDDVTVHWIGLDHFRVVNDSLGRPVGDLILGTVADRLRERYGDGAVVARTGGDMFVVASRSTTGFADAILALLAEPMMVDDVEIVMSASIGIASERLADPVDRTAATAVAEELARTASTGMYEAKAAGRGRWKRSSTALDQAAVSEIRLLGEIRAALAGDQLRLEFQPQLDLRTGRVHGVEALLRWDHPERGPVSPAGFIEVAEKSGLIAQLGTWVCRTAIAEAVEWGAGALPLQVSVNVSARQLGDSGFAGAVASMLTEFALDPARLTVELTETGLVLDTASARETMAALRAIGVRVSIDDFGTGHAGFSYLKEFEIDEVKIDRSFVDRLDATPEDTAIIVSCIEVAHAHGATVVAEGVETAAQLARLTELGCDVAQGFHYARPLRSDALVEFLAR
ncbi:sensor domain-containing protein [Marisediminicola senii]|uniref:sensor domain-containing protein n=1 Tax=Marisediminicola senii TaxID=2711233 RepID=UPI0013ECC6AC|nr:EAL domain-containing protein [Marisediminicola senii]